MSQYSEDEVEQIMHWLRAVLLTEDTDHEIPDNIYANYQKWRR